jgi:hypothetical protein
VSKNRFVWTFGVLGWGLPCGVLFAWALSGNHGLGFGVWLAISVPAWCVGGYAFGHALFRRLQRTRSQAGAAP